MAPLVLHNKTVSNLKLQCSYVLLCIIACGLACCSLIELWIACSLAAYSLKAASQNYFLFIFFMPIENHLVDLWGFWWMSLHYYLIASAVYEVVGCWSLGKFHYYI